MAEYDIIMTWDDEASVWIAESNDIPGLILESASFDDLVERVKTATPELLVMNGKSPECILNFVSDRKDEVA